MLKRIRNWQIFLVNKLRYHGRSNTDLFDDIYFNGRWGSGDDGYISSGAGSRPENTREYEEFVAEFVKARKNIGSIVDIGCGDFQVAQRILVKLSSPVQYTGCDVSKIVIGNNQAYQNDRVKFVHLDAEIEDLPRGDLVLVREVLQHLSNSAVKSVLDKLRPFPYVLVTNSVPKNPKAWNVDIPTGPWTRRSHGSGIWPEHPPFSMPVEELLETSHRINEDMVMRTVLLCRNGSGAN